MAQLPTVPGTGEVLHRLKYLDQLDVLLKSLHDVGCPRNRAHDRKLHYHQCCMLILLYLFNPAAKTLRSLQQASEFKNVQRRLRRPPISLGSFSESVFVFDAQRLRMIVGQLGQQLDPHARDQRFKRPARHRYPRRRHHPRGIAAHGRASFLKTPTGNGPTKWWLHTHFGVDRHVPLRIDITRAMGVAADEREVLGRTMGAIFSMSWISAMPSSSCSTKKWRSTAAICAAFQLDQHAIRDSQFSRMS
jgi:hypothetical protein